MIDGIDCAFLRDTAHGGAPDQPSNIAAMLSDFVAQAKDSLDVAIYDFRLDEPLAAPVVSAFKQAAGSGVKVRIAYDAGKPQAQSTVAFASAGADPAPMGTGAWLDEQFSGAPIELKPIHATPHLMHNKYIVRDLSSPRAAVWMGSANFTNAAWTRQENNVARFVSPELASAYEADFKDLWDSGEIKEAGAGDVGEAAIGTDEVAWDFSPGDGPAIDTRLVSAIKEANDRIRIASMVLTSHTVLGALVEAIESGKDLAGIYDGGQMDEIEEDYRRHNDSEILEIWEKVKTALVAKPTPRYTPTGPHDFMHNKVLVSDNDVLTGSYNFSKNAEQNAENQVRIADTHIADEYAKYVDELVAAYKP
jgi:phosphatidylserine/phosphatidylglycerophosphate/cardiolipin synthase-like enzyme